MLPSQELKDFISFLLNSPQGSPALARLGLVVREDAELFGPDELLLFFRQHTAIEKLTYDPSTKDQEFFGALKQVLKQENWLFLVLERDLSGKLVNFLNKFRYHHTIDIENGSLPHSLAVPERAKIIVYADRNLIETKLSYPHFYELFSVVVSV